MSHSEIRFKRVGGALDIASRTKVFGSEANAKRLICGVCQFGKEEDWTPMMKHSRCPACGNRDDHIERQP